jgi:hypothetical protein
MTYSVDVGGVSDLTTRVTTEMDEAADAVESALEAVDDTIAAAAGEAGLAGAISSATEARRTTGPNLVGRAGELVRTLQSNAVLYVQADESMAASTTAAQASSTPANPYLNRFGGAAVR